MEKLWNQINSILWTVFYRPTFADFVDIGIVAFLIYQLMMLTKQTRANAVLKGIFVLLITSGLANVFGLTALTWLLQVVLENGAIVLVLLFQPELRKALEQLGNKAKVEGTTRSSLSDDQKIIEEITYCLINLSRRHVGALIVFERKTGLNDVIETGTTLDAVITASLLENIFEPNTPLHDGAVVIRGNRIMAAGCILSLSEDKEIGKDLGTRHRAALGMSESTDAMVFVVSEETGIISMAEKGELIRHLDAKAIKDLLSNIYTEKNKGLFASVKSSLTHSYHRWTERKWDK
ncbi:MAG: TIGR00159 family protein [Clostridiales bacterium]|nr:TIGR00159 family protein [Clostridiales bacterium]